MSGFAEKRKLLLEVIDDMAKKARPPSLSHVPISQVK